MTDTPKSKAAKTGLPGAAANRLRSGGGTASAHPEANLLAAFSEQALTAPERDEVLTHLAQCADCREVVALSLPPASEVLSPKPVEIRGWFGMRPEVMRWAVVGASAAVVVAAVLVVRPEFESARPDAYRTIAAQPERAESKVAEPLLSAKAQPEKAASVGAEKDKGVAERERSADAPARLDGSADKPSVQRAGPVTMAREAAGPPPASAPPPALGGLRDMRASGGVGAGTGAGVGAGAGEARNQAAEPRLGQAAAAKPAEAVATQASRITSDSRVARDEDASTAKQVAGNKDLAKEDAKADSLLTFGVVNRAEIAEMQSARSMKAMRKASNESGRTWRVLEGKLQSSRDGGQSWEAVSVPAGVKVLAVDAGHPLASSVWVGGAQGVVLASSDYGVAWKQIKGEWSGDVVFLQFSDAKTAVLRTSTKEEWFTEDGGVSWKKR